MITHRQMCFFVSVVEQQGFAAAARRLSADTRTLRLDIGRLEKAMGTRLIERHARGTYPTYEGRALYERLRKTLDESKSAARATAGDVRQTITVGVVNSMLAREGRDMARRAARHLRGSRIRFVEYPNAGLLGALARGEIDTALMYDPEWRPGLSMVPLFEEQMVFVSAARRVATSTIECGDVLVAPLALPGKDDPARIKLEAAAYYLGLAPNVVFEISSNAEIRKIVARSFVDSVMPLASASRRMGVRPLIARAIVNPSVKCTLHVIRETNRPWSAHHEAMLDFVGTAMQEVAATLGALARPLIASDLPLSHALREGQRLALPRRDSSEPLVADASRGKRVSATEAMAPS